MHKHMSPSSIDGNVCVYVYKFVRSNNIKLTENIHPFIWRETPYKICAFFYFNDP